MKPKIAATAAILGVAALAAIGCDREPTSRTAYINSGASATASSANIPAPPPPAIHPPPAGTEIPNTVPSAPAAAAATPAPQANAAPAPAPAPVEAAKPGDSAPPAPR